VPIEIERKFLVVDDAWRGAVESSADYRQGYLAATERCTVRIRSDGGRAWLTIKRPTAGIARAEFEYAVPSAEGDEILATLCLQPPLEKTRHRVRHGAHLWEVDVFHGENDGLVLAEVELSSVDEAFELPRWVGTEVSDDPRYRNAALARRPYRDWGEG